MDNTITKETLDSEAKSIGQKTAAATKKPAIFKTVNGKQVWVGGHIQAGQLQPNASAPPQVEDPLDGAKDTVKNITTKTVAITPAADALTKEQLDEKARVSAQAKVQWQTDVKTLEDTLEDRPSTEEKLQTLREEQGVQKYADQLNLLRPQVAQLQADVNNLTVEENNKASLLDEKLASRAAIDQATKVMAREYDRKRASASAQLGAKAAMMQAYEGNLTTARSLVSDSLAAWTYDQQIKVQDLTTLMTVHKDWYNSLDSDYKSELSNSRQEWQRELTQKRADMQNKMNLMIDAAAKGIDLGWDSARLDEMTSEDATRQYVNKVAPEMAEEDLMDVELLQKEYNEAIATGAIPSDTTFQQYYAKMTNFGTESLSRVAELSQQYAELVAKGAIPKGTTEADFIAEALGIDLTTPTDGFPGAQNDWIEGTPVTAAQIKLMKERIYSQVTLPDELATALQENFDVQFDTVRSNDELQDLIQLKYRLDVDTMSPQETHDVLETMIAFSGVASEQLDFFRATNDALLAQQTQIEKDVAHERWLRFPFRSLTPEELAAARKRAQEQLNITPSKGITLPSLSVDAAKERLKQAGGTYNRGLQQLYGNLWGNK